MKQLTHASTHPRSRPWTQGGEIRKGFADRDDIGAEIASGVLPFVCKVELWYARTYHISLPWPVFQAQGKREAYTLLKSWWPQGFRPLSSFLCPLISPNASVLLSFKIQPKQCRKKKWIPVRSKAEMNAQTCPASSVVDKEASWCSVKNNNTVVKIILL